MEASSSTFHPIIAPTFSKFPKDAHLAPPLAANPLEPCGFFDEEFHSITMSGGCGGEGHVGHYYVTPRVPSV